MSKTMRAVDIKAGTGHADALYIKDSVPKPTPSSGEAIVKVKAFGLNRMDLLQREGLYPVPSQAPKTLGVEFSGTIESLGTDIKEGFNVGDEVFGLAYGGAYAEFIAVSTHMLLKKPGHLSWEEAAGVPETWITATQAMFLVGEFSKGKSILWHAGASSVSISGIQLAKNSGASAIYVTAGSQEKIDFCVKELGATAGFNYKTQDWAKEILAATDGKGVDIVIDFVGANYFQGNLNVAAKDGRVVHLGAMSGTKLPNGVDMSAFVMKRVRFEGSTLRSRDVEYQGKLRNKLEEYIPKFEDGTFKIFVDKVFPWEQVVDAHKEMEKNTNAARKYATERYFVPEAKNLACKITEPTQVVE
ncbi:quinone oxidoreductase [Sclerotinia borealis F-4128]|uniref:Quinone oxidoreductase n=1 Tax=Sclerotinia borealis (strain F-4128) TaxID=1432307 RepID=W9CC08_SCLBF|nr:quinone oxidoreductase [Sclerotinia borealis F-4128]